jgi:hypothetical protein
MSRFRDELRVIPRTAWYLAWGIYFVLATLVFRFGMLPDPKFRTWPLCGKAAFVYGLFLLLVALLLLVGYVYADAKRRKMRYVMWTWLALLIPDGIGVILYFLLRDPMPLPCPSCHAEVPAKFTFCAHCGAALKPTCPQCGKAVEPAWANCPECGVKLPRPTTSHA